MTLKLKLKVNPSKDKNDSEKRPTPRIKIKPLKKEPSDGVSKPKKEKLKKLKISLGKASSPSQNDSATPVAPAPVVKKVPKVRIKPTRIPGEGYDSEAPDLEDDPLIEQGIVVRFANDRNLDFVHNAVDTGDLSNVNIKWITRDKAVVNVNSTLYSARLIDLPTLTELYKTVDKKNIFKTIDISQILLVLHPINPKQLNMEQDFEVPEEYIYVHPIYKYSPSNEIRNTKTVYRHGLAYAYEDVYRRFRPQKVNHRVMTDIESRVDELVRRDNEAQESHYEFTDPKGHNMFSNSNSHTPSTMPSTPSRLEEEEEVQEEEMAMDIEDDIDNALEQELAEALDSTSNNTAATVLMKSVFDNEDAGSGEDNNGQEEEDDDEEDEDDEEEEEEDEDDTSKGGNSLAKKLEEEISDLERAAEKQKMLLATASFKMMRMKFQSAYNSLKAQIDQKKRELAKIQESQGPKLEKETQEADAEEDAEDEEEDDDEEEDENEGEANEQEARQESEGIRDEKEEKADDAEGDDENEDFDDFQGLF
ncbi:hypothetical protein CLUG_00655 [Clavispora lusitaniae ATCC 42720]|uniref:TAFII55 protein conserved region domain-containing protein n=1 Tax=Clavispora lusitaniae (strain ATCC 42720) TaxID=306902 RepID=C4XXI2_CLAL4|nr:uncharacterized protein CLUG_00655 [Clavispora lusitaniae ATCC 42720]EEQ36532.1 hypothetical protein CLUG_00655 [Clavispora lusitaniae ATCC 42720]